MIRAAWPGSNGSTMPTKPAVEPVAGLLAGVVVAAPAPPLDDDEDDELLQPAARLTTPTNNATRAMYPRRPIPAHPSAKPSSLATIVAGTGTARTSAATAPFGPQISGLMSSAARTSPSSHASAERPVMAVAIASRSAAGWPRAPAR